MHIYDFNELVGNVYTVNLIKRMLQNKSFPHFTILHGNFGTGKSTCAKITAMSLTCDHPENGNPCGVCPSCKANMKAFESTGESMCVKIVNLGILLNKAEVNELIKDVFVLQGGEKPRVYIFDEAHVLSNLSGAQTALLEEIDRMPNNTYVIMCTTRKYDIIPELASRAMTFSFSKLTPDESRYLIKKISHVQMPVEITEMVVKTSNGVPRDVIKNVEFIISNDITVEEYREYVEDISEAYLMLLFESMNDKSAMSFVGMMDDLCNTRTPGEILEALKEFVLQALFAIEGAKTSFTGNEVETLKELMDINVLNKMLMSLEKMQRNPNESDLKMLLYRFRLLIQGRTVKNVIAETSQVASIERERAKAEVITKKKIESSGTKSVLHPLTVNAFN